MSNSGWGVASLPADEPHSSVRPRRVARLRRVYPDWPAAQIESLPNELLQLIFSSLPTSALKEAALVSKCFHRHATEFLWQHVNLMDQWTLHVNHDTANTYGDGGRGQRDEHDDTHIIQKLYILATNPAIAAKVQVLTHRCHLPTPNIFSELPHMYFNAPHLSQDDRTHTLLWLAIRNLVNVHTLRIIYGHYNLTRILLAAFLDCRRPQRVPLRKLWLESCCLSGFGTNYTTDLFASDYATGLESLRIRRLRVESSDTPERSRMQEFDYRLSRGGRYKAMHDAAGGFLYSTVELSPQISRPGIDLPSPAELKAKADEFDTSIWNQVPEIQQLVDLNQLPYPTLKMWPPNPMMTIIEKSRSTLTSLNLDWVLWRQRDSYANAPATRDLQYLSQLRFPHLRAFQVRNAVVPETGLPADVYLLEDMFLEFMEAHPKIKCLAWPLDRFYSHVKQSTECQMRARGVVAHLGNVLVDLRLDCFYSANGEKNTDEGREPQEQQERIRRRRFISEFAPHMCKVEQLKLEGGIPRDEKRELVRALHYSPLKKLVLIGVNFPIGNTWGARGAELTKKDANHGSDATFQLEEEDIQGILSSYKRNTQPASNFTFEPYYGWRAEVPFLQTIALHHASTIEELKLCGYNGSPILSSLTPITMPLLYPLRHFHNLRQLVVSFWLLTWWGDRYRDVDIIKSWMDTRSPNSTAVVVVTPPVSPCITPPVDPAMMPPYPHRSQERPQNFNRWGVELKTKYSPAALAWSVGENIGPCLSEAALARPGGVRVRASFCLGSRDEGRSANDIFDLDIRLGKGGRPLEFIGPREEMEKGRFWQKLEKRRWF